MLNYAKKILKNWTEISDKKSDGVKKLKLLVQITDNMYKGGQESSSTASAYSSLLFGAVFQPVCCILPKVMEL